MLPQMASYHLYLDLGTNTGVQIHKLYNPSSFAGSPVKKYFERYFGNTTTSRARVCSFGFEPNPQHALALSAAEKRYSGEGRVVKIFSAGAGTFNGWGAFHTDNVRLLLVTLVSIR